MFDEPLPRDAEPSGGGLPYSLLIFIALGISLLLAALLLWRADVLAWPFALPWTRSTLTRASNSTRRSTAPPPSWRAPPTGFDTSAVGRAVRAVAYCVIVLGGIVLGLIASWLTSA